MRKEIAASALAMLALSAPAFADWHYDTVQSLGIGYDGNTVTFSLLGWARTNSV